MSPEAPNLHRTIGPPPPSEPSAEIVAPQPPVELLPVPESFIADQQRRQQEEVEQRARDLAETAKVARSIVEDAEAAGIVTEPSAVTPPHDPSGRFGIAPIPAPMPADPSHVPGYNGRVRR